MNLVCENELHGKWKMASYVFFRKNIMNISQFFFVLAFKAQRNSSVMRENVFVIFFLIFFILYTFPSILRIKNNILLTFSFRLNITMTLNIILSNCIKFYKIIIWCKKMNTILTFGGDYHRFGLGAYRILVISTPL